jgi:ABC-2 type transport system permease protein
VRVSRAIGRIAVVARKELLQLRRDRLTLGMMAILPLVQLLLFGYAIDTDVRHMPTLVYDQDGTARSRDLARRLDATGFYDLVGGVTSYDEVATAFRAGEASVALVVPAGFSADVATGRPTQVQLLVDSSDPQTVASATNTAAAVAGAWSAELRVQRLGPAGFDPIGLEVATWYNPDLRTAVFIVPGLVGVILTMTMVMLTSMAIARERERGTLEQLIVSPVRSLELVVGKIFPYVAIGYVQMSLVLGAGAVIFDVPFAGDLVLLYLLAFVFIAANLALGLLFSTVAQNQQQAMQMSVFFLLPNVLLSGFMFPWDAMPYAAQAISQALPLTHFLRIIRGIALKGAGFSDVAGEVVWLLGILLALVTIAALRFQKKLG